MIKRYDPDLDWSGCYYEGETPYAAMAHMTYGSWVKYSDYEALQAKYDALLLEFKPSSMSPEQLQKWTAHQRPL